MKKILFILFVLLFGVSVIADAKPHTKQNVHHKNKVYKYKKPKTKVYHFSAKCKHKKCKLSKIYKVK